MRRAAGIACLAAVAALGGGCGGGGGDQEAAVRAVVQRYLTALGHDRPAAACRELTDESRDRLTEFAREKLHSRHPSCEVVIAGLERSAAVHVRALGRARVGDVKVDGDRATAQISGTNDPARLERGDDGRWGIVATPSGETD